MLNLKLANNIYIRAASPSSAAASCFWNEHAFLCLALLLRRCCVERCLAVSQDDTLEKKQLRRQRADGQQDKRLAGDHVAGDVLMGFRAKGGEMFPPLASMIPDACPIS